MKSPIFIVSTGRTGTKFFSKFFEQICENVQVFHVNKFGRIQNLIGNLYLNGILSDNLANKLWRHFNLSRINNNSLRYIECNPYYYSMIPIIIRNFPKSKIISIFREPKAFVCSSIKWENQRVKSKIVNQFLPFWQPIFSFDRYPFSKDIYYKRVDFYSKIWTKKNDQILKSLPYTENCASVKFEDIFINDHGDKILKNLMLSLRLNFNDNFSDSIFKRKVNDTNKDLIDSWDDKCDFILNKNCKSIKQRLGYI